LVKLIQELIHFDPEKTAFFKIPKLKNDGLLAFFIPRYQRKPLPPFQNTQKSVSCRALTICPWAKKKAILDCARLFAGRKSTARSFSLFIPAWYGCGVWFCSRGIKRAQDDSVFQNKNPGQHAPTGIF
jgi:hypothetical protein